MTGPIERPRYILDTNVLVAAALPPAGPRNRGLMVRQVVQAAREQGVLLLSAATRAELEEVMARPVFDRFASPDARCRFVAALLEEAEVIEPRVTVRLCRDATDDKFLALALGGRAAALVTQDKAVLALGTVGCTRILHPNAFAALVGV